MTDGHDSPSGATRGTDTDAAHHWDASRWFDTPSTAIVDAIATTTGREPTSMPPLQRYVDPDALDALLAPGRNGRNNRVGVSFQYDGLPVAVDSDGGIEVGTGNVDGG